MFQVDIHWYNILMFDGSGITVVNIGYNKNIGNGMELIWYVFAHYSNISVSSW